MRDEQDRILGFLGRDTSGHPGAPKYRNPTRTTTYDKSRLLYRPDPARPVPDGARLVVVEGPLDALAVAAHAARWGRADDFVAVAACGAAATPQHADAIARLRNGPVVIALDADPAGARGTRTWVDLLARQRQQSVHVAELPDGQDPAARLAHQPRAALGDFDPGAGPWSPKPPGAHLVQLALAGTLPADPSRRRPRRTDPVCRPPRPPRRPRSGRPCRGGDDPPGLEPPRLVQPRRPRRRPPRPPRTGYRPSRPAPTSPPDGRAQPLTPARRPQPTRSAAHAKRHRRTTGSPEPPTTWPPPPTSPTRPAPPPVSPWPGRSSWSAPS